MHPGVSQSMHMVTILLLQRQHKHGGAIGGTAEVHKQDTRHRAWSDSAAYTRRTAGQQYMDIMTEKVKSEIKDIILLCRGATDIYTSTVKNRKKKRKLSASINLLFGPTSPLGSLTKGVAQRGIGQCWFSSVHPSCILFEISGKHPPDAMAYSLCCAVGGRPSFVEVGFHIVARRFHPGRK